VETICCLIQRGEYTVLTLIHRWSCACSAVSRADERTCRQRRTPPRVSWSLAVWRQVAAVRQSLTSDGRQLPRRTHTNCHANVNIFMQIKLRIKRNSTAITGTKLWRWAAGHFEEMLKLRMNVNYKKSNTYIHIWATSVDNNWPADRHFNDYFV